MTADDKPLFQLMNGRPSLPSTRFHQLNNSPTHGNLVGSPPGFMNVMVLRCHVLESYDKLTLGRHSYMLGLLR
jgi:hypothetical protein